MKKRFIFDENYIKRHSKKAMVKWLIAGGVLLALIIIIIVVVVNSKDKKPKGETNTVELVSELMVEVGSPIPDVKSYFSEDSKINKKDVKITYQDGMISYDDSACSDEEKDKIKNSNKKLDEYECVKQVLNKEGTYEVKIKINNKEYKVSLIVADTMPPEVILKEKEIYAKDEYQPEDFIESCEDPSGECSYKFYDKDVDESGNAINYSNISEVGEHTVKIVVIDSKGNEGVAQAKLIVKNRDANMFTVTFDSAGGSKVSSQSVLSGATISEPSAPSRNGFTFDGWYLNDQKYDFNTNINSDINLVAKWSQNGGGGVTPPPGPSGPTVVNVTGITLNYKQLGLKVGESKKVSATVSPSNATNKNVSWSSSNGNVAGVNNGVITAYQQGTAVITATAGNRSASLTVTVTPSGGGTSTCTYGDTVYDTSRYTLSVNLTSNNCAANPNRNYNESVSAADYQRLVNSLTNMGYRMVSGEFVYQPSNVKIFNNAGTGLVGYQITITVKVKHPDNPYRQQTATYIIKNDGTRHFINNNISRNGMTLGN